MMSQSITFKEVSIAFNDTGSGSTVVLLHGFLENQTMWGDVVAELSKNHRVITIDLLGHGDTGCHGYVHTMEEMADAVYEVLHHLHLRKVFVAGHSMGGYVALAFAEKHPAMIKGLCLMNSTAQGDREDRKEIRTRACKMAQHNYQNLVKMSIANLFEPASLNAFTTEVATVKEQALKTSLQGYIAAQEGMKTRINREEVAKKHNAFYIIGEQDPVINSQTIINEAKRNNAAYLMLEGGHMSHIEHKQQLIAALVGFAAV